MALQRDCPCPIELMCMVRGNRSLEMRFHALFFADHVRGEWFRATPKLLDLIALIVEVGGIATDKLPERGVKLYGPQAERLRSHA